MAYEDLMPQSYDARLCDWDLEMVEKLNQPKLVLHFEFEHEQKSYKMKFECFAYKKDGSISKKYLDTLRTCGFKGSKTTDLLDDKEALNVSKVYSIDCKKDNNGYWKVEWVNTPEGFSDKVASRKALSGFDFSKIDGALMQAGISQPKKQIKNYATPDPVKDDNDDIPF